jgi:hypothetical protein
MTAIDILRQSSFGSRTAEEEQDSIGSYFVQTEQWRRVFAGAVDVVYGQKGSGKSAIYSLILKSSDELFDKNVIVIAGERPQGAPAFSSIKDDFPVSESEFVNLWKIYFLTLVGHAIKDYGIDNPKSRKLVGTLEEADLLPAGFSLSKYLKYAFDYLKSFRPRVSGIEGGISIDPTTLAPSATTKIVFAEPSRENAKLGAIFVDELFQIANAAFEESGYSIWIMLDRLDVAFSESVELETAALRSLFKFYLDTKQIDRIRPKIFLRTDIWDNLSKDGFREASHIEKSLTIQWNDDDLNHLIIRRVIHNDAICEAYNVNRQDVASSTERQEALWDQIFPKQVDSGPNKPTTFNWLLSRTRDASQRSAPRELIHFLNELRDRQISRIERGERGPTENRLFEQVTFKEALPEVSRVRLQQTLYAEYPSQKKNVERLKDQKATQSASSLAEIWSVDEVTASSYAADLERIGFFERFGQGWRVPFIYRPALNLVQGSSE